MSGPFWHAGAQSSRRSVGLPTALTICSVGCLGVPRGAVQQGPHVLGAWVGERLVMPGSSPRRSVLLELVLCRWLWFS